MADFAGWLLIQTPTIKGDDGAFLIALLFLLTTFIGFGILGIAYLVTGSLDVNDHSDRGQAKT
jgi:hypothetical protein